MTVRKRACSPTLTFYVMSGEESIYVSVFDTSVGPCFTVNMTAVTHGGLRWVRGITAIFHLNENGNFTFDYRGFYDPSLRETHAAGKLIAS